MHNRKQYDCEQVVIVPVDKKLIIDATAIAVSIDCLHLNFYDSKQGKSTFADALIKLENPILRLL